MQRVPAKRRRTFLARTSIVTSFAIGGLFACAALGEGCASADPDAPPSLRNPPTRNPEDGGTADGSTTKPNGSDADEPDPADSGKPLVITKWTGALDASPTVEFGGTGNYCLYSVTMKNIRADFFLDDADNKPLDATVQAYMEEKTVGTCGVSPQAANLHNYTMRQMTETNGVVRLDFDRNLDNRPRASLVFEGSFSGTDQLNGTLTWHRTDIGAPFDWTVKVSIQLTPSSS